MKDRSSQNLRKLATTLATLPLWNETKHPATARVNGDRGSCSSS